MKRVTKHGRKRLEQRNINKGRNGISVLAKKKGKTKFNYEGDFYDYLETKENEGKIVKVYKDNIYIYSKNSRNLITTYPAPKKYIPTEKYLMNKKKIYVIQNINVLYKKNCKITLKDETIIKGIILNKLYNDREFLVGIIIIDDEKNKNEILIDEIESIELNNEDVTKNIIEKMEIK